MDTCLAPDVPAAVDELSTLTVSRMLTGSRAVPMALIRDGRLAFANPAFRSLFRAGERIVGTPVLQLIAEPSHAAMRQALTEPAKTSVIFRGRANRLDGSSFDVELFVAQETLDGVSTTCVFGEDVTWRRLAEKNLSELAYTDALTGLPNRALAMDRLRDAIVQARAEGSGLAVFMADLDGLKQVNDTCGHQAGDAVLQVTARRFLACIRDRDTLARLGGDEFCVVLPRVRDGHDAEIVAGRLVRAVRQAIAIRSEAVRVGVSVGIALFPQHGATPDDMIAAADAALYEAKRYGKGRFCMARVQESPPPISPPLIVWTNAHDVGIAEIDSQHRQLADCLNDVSAALKRGDEAMAISARMTATLAFARHHFETEERLMDEAGFADAAAHRTSHAHLLADLESFSAGCDTRSLSLATRFLQEWLLRHIDGADRELAVALRAHRTA